MTKNKRAMKYPHHISYRISAEKSAEIHKLLIGGETLNAYARSVIDPERILPLKNQDKSKEAAAILKYFSAEFDDHVKVFRGIINAKYFTVISIKSQVNKFDYLLENIMHELIEVEHEFLPTNNEKAPTKKKGLIINDEGNKTVKVDFRISNEMYVELEKRALGNESIAQLCRAMLEPSRYIQPTDFATHKALSKVRNFYSSRFVSLTQTFQELVDEASRKDRKTLSSEVLAPTLELMNQVDYLAQKLLGVNLYKRQKSEPKIKC